MSNFLKHPVFKDQLLIDYAGIESETILLVFLAIV